MKCIFIFSPLLLQTDECPLHSCLIITDGGCCKASEKQIKVVCEWIEITRSEKPGQFSTSGLLRLMLAVPINYRHGDYEGELVIVYGSSYCYHRHYQFTLVEVITCQYYRVTVKTFCSLSGRVIVLTRCIF